MAGAGARIPECKQVNDRGNRDQQQAAENCNCTETRFARSGRLRSRQRHYLSAAADMKARQVCTFGELNDDGIVGTLGAVIFGQFYAEASGLNPNG